MELDRLERLRAWLSAEAILALAGFGTAQREAEPRVPAVLEGFVLDPHGDPAEGVRVVSSAGGSARTDAAGSYRLELEVPLEATSVQLTALAGRSRIASTTVALGTAGPIRANPLLLAQPSACTPAWLATFGPHPGVFSEVRALAVYDDGHGAALYAGGEFTSAGGAPASRIVRWDGESWTTLGTGLNDAVYALTVFDDGSGEALYAGGTFTTAGGVAARGIARWDGSSWSAVGGGVNGSVLSFATFDDGGGTALFVGGGFSSAGGVAASNVARWNGASWVPLAGGRSGGVWALAVFDDGGGPALFVGANKLNGQQVVGNVTKWDGASWILLGPQLDKSVRALTTFDDGSGSALYAAGDFTTVAGSPANGIARWDGAGWTTPGYFPSPAGIRVHSLAVFDDGTGPALHAGGAFGFLVKAGVARWNGTSWAPVGSQMEGDEPIQTLLGYDDGHGPRLHVAGYFTSPAGARNLARWESPSWMPLGDGVSGAVKALASFDDGGGSTLYAGGQFLSAGGVVTRRIGKWDGAQWSALGSGIEAAPSGSGIVYEVLALATFDDGGGPDLYVGGQFATAGGITANGIARWDGASWSTLGSGIGSVVGARVRALVVFDDGGGPDLYAGGSFDTAGGVAANDVARWNGTSWSALGSGVGGSVHALAVFDDGSGPALYAGGEFGTAGGLPANRIARWNGASWSPLGGGIGGLVRALVVFDDGGGPALYAAGGFTLAGGVVANSIARWDGASWSALGTGLAASILTRTVCGLAVFDDGSGAALYAGGDLVTAGGIAANRIARWDGASWSALGAGLTFVDPAAGTLGALTAFDDGDGPALFAGGHFTAFDCGDANLARWGCRDEAPVLSCPTSVVVPDGFADGAGEVVSFTVTATDDFDPAPSVTCVPPSGSFFPVGTTLVDCTATDATGHSASRQFPVTVQPKARRR